MADRPAIVLRAADIQAESRTFSHPWNPNSEITGAFLARAAGLTRVGVNLARLKAGRESFVPHAHQREEEWVFIVSGRAIALIGEEEIEIGEGDFIGYPAPQMVHQLKNPGPDDLVYLMGGDAPDYDAVDFPVQKKRLVRIGTDSRIYDAGSDDPSGHPDAEAFAARKEES